VQRRLRLQLSWANEPAISVLVIRRTSKAGYTLGGAHWRSDPSFFLVFGGSHPPSPVPVACPQAAAADAAMAMKGPGLFSDIGKKAKGTSS
jgi:hypothetical protein